MDGYDRYQVTFTLDGVGVAFQGDDQMYSQYINGPIFFETDDVEVVEPQKVSVTAFKETFEYGGEEFISVEDTEGEELLHIYSIWSRYSDETVVMVESPKMREVESFSYDLW